VHVFLKILRKTEEYGENLLRCKNKKKEVKGLTKLLLPTSKTKQF